jgi:GNAT superfamily N-acetyltransferase
LMAGTQRNSDRAGCSDNAAEINMEWRRGEYVISTDRERIDFQTVHAFLSCSYWSPGIPRELVERAARHSLTFGVYHEPAEGPGRQVGYARVLTDHVAFAYLMDVFVLEEHRGQGLARWLMETIVSLPELQGIRSWLLKTRDAQGLYEKFGFAPPSDSERFMTRAEHRGYARRSAF